MEQNNKFDFRVWSANNWFVYSIMSIPPWAVLYDLIRSLCGWNYIIPLAVSLLGFQLIAGAMLIISVTAWKKYRNW
jgi:hypothetical protein